MKRRLAPVLMMVAVALAPRAVRAQAPPQLPKAETVLDQYVEATGGKAAYDKVKNRVSKGTLEISGANIQGKVHSTQAAPDKMVTIMDLGQLGKTSQGSNGQVVWESSPFTGDRVLEGEERGETMLRARFNSETGWRELYPKVECTGVEDVDGKPAFKVVLTPKVGKPTTQFYDRGTHLMVKQTATTKGPMGEIEVEIYPSDYRKVDGILMPFAVRQKVLTQEIVIKLDDVQHNVDLPADAFKLPEGVEALANKAKPDK